MLALWIIIFIGLVRSSDETIYSCDSNASCGCSINPAVVNRVVNGEEARKSTWSWAVSISIRGNLCGGSILTESWIITAAHCVDGIQQESEVIVYAGSNLIFGGNHSRTASQIIIHPDYTTTMKTLENDIALIRLSSPFDMSDPQLKKICLPTASSQIIGNGQLYEWPVPGTTVNIFFSSKKHSKVFSR
jgi:secreted trypsin-like serine protease